MDIKLKKLIALLALAALPSVASAEVLAWHIEAASYPATDTTVDVIDGKYWITPEDVCAIGIDLSKLPTTNGKVDLASVGGLTVDENNAVLKVDTKAELMAVTQIDLSHPGMFQKPDQPKGTFVNYELSGNQSVGGGASYLTGLFDANTFVHQVRINYQGVARTNATQTAPALQRLAASVSKENADTGITWVAGDAESRPGSNVAPVRFTGVQYRKDFSLDPSFITVPTYSTLGLAAAPSTIDVMMGNQRVLSQPVPAGPFAITNMQPLLGTSGVNIIVKDLFGHQQIISSPIFGNPNLLAAGLTDYSFQAGQIRPTLNTTESPFASGFYRRGITQTFSAEFNAEASQPGFSLPAVRHIGVNSDIATPIGNFSAGFRVGTGSKENLGFQNAWHTNNKWNTSLSASISKASSDYLQMGGGLVHTLTETLAGTVQHNRLSFSTLLSKSNGMSLQNFGFVLNPFRPSDTTWSATATHIGGLASNTMLMVFASIPIDSGFALNRNQQASTGITQSGISSTATATYTNRPTSNYGAAYGLHSEASTPLKRLDASVDYRAYSSDFGISSSTTTQNQNTQTGLIEYMRGSLVTDGEYVGPTRWIDNGFAVIDSGAPGAIVQINNVPSAVADKSGMAVVSDFQPFMKTEIRLAPDSLPDNFDDVKVSISTYRRAGSKVVFRGHSQAMVSVPGHTSGVLTVSGQDYILTEQGAYVELPEGNYSGTVGQEIFQFTIPKSTSEMAIVTAQHSK